jgi:hypothetical protein
MVLVIQLSRIPLRAAHAVKTIKYKNEENFSILTGNFWTEAWNAKI